eukprot:1695632-Pleurochrysis_carterae.AAC.1
MRALEAELGGSCRVAAALAAAAGRSAVAAALTSADSAPAIRAAAREWRGVLARVSAAGGGPAQTHPPADWSEAPDRLLQVLAEADRLGPQPPTGPAQPCGALTTPLLTPPPPPAQL